MVDTLKVADKVYAGSGETAVRHQILREPGRDYAHIVNQAVVVFPTANDAGAFFTASAQRWPKCANRQYTSTETGNPDRKSTAGPVTNTNGMLSAYRTADDARGWACQRALTVRNNVAIDVSACGYDWSSPAVNIATQIAARVPTQ